MASQVNRETQQSAPIGDERLSSLVHDLRHSLHVIRLGIELLQEARNEEKIAELCRAMETEERQASQLLEDLLAAVGYSGGH